MKKEQQQNFKKKQTKTQNMDLSYIIRTAVGNENMQNLGDYGIEIVASDAELAGKIKLVSVVDEGGV